MSNYKSCGNCYFKKEGYCYVCISAECPMWQPIHCPKCGGILSELREHDGKQYRHCYACHFEFREGKLT